MYNQYPFNTNSFIPYNATSSTPATGLLGLGKKAFNWDGFLNNAQRTLNVINQAMPIYNQVKPMFKNMGTMFKVIGELNRSTPTTTNTVNTTTTEPPKTTNASTPQFFA